MPKRIFVWGALSACILWLTAFNLSLPFQQGKTFAQLPPDTPLTVGITHVTLGDDRAKNRVFWDHTLQVIDSLPQHRGYLGHKVRKKILGKEAWTMTIWPTPKPWLVLSGVIPIARRCKMGWMLWPPVALSLPHSPAPTCRWTGPRPKP